MATRDTKHIPVPLNKFTRHYNLFIFFLLIVVCFYMYKGFQSIVYAITQDYIAIYVGSKYIISHPTFAFVMSFPHFVPLLYVYFFIIQWLTNDIQWLNVTFSLVIHVTNSFIIFKITQMLSGRRLLPGLVASIFFLVSIIHIDSLLSFSHAYPIMTSFFGLLSLYFFLKVSTLGDNYQKKELYLSVFFYLLSTCFGLNFIGLAFFYFAVMLIKIRRFRNDFIYMLLIVSLYFTIVFSLQNAIRPLYGVLDVSTVSISLGGLLKKINNFEYSFLHLTSLFFPGFPITIASFLNETTAILENVSTYHNKYYPYFSLFILFIPLLFLQKEKIQKLYSMLILMYLLFIPYLFSPKGLNSRHLAQTVAVSSIFLGLLFHYSSESIERIGKNVLQKSLHILLIFFVGFFIIKYSVIARHEIVGFIKYNSSFSPFISKFIEEFKKVEVTNTKKQIYFLKNEIPNKYSFLGSPVHCYYLFHLAVEYKSLPADFYKYVYIDLDTNKPMDIEACKNYSIRLPDGAFYGYYRDKKKMIELLRNNPDIIQNDIIVLTWDDGLKREQFSLDPE